jgi:hypothetical protein
MLLFHGKISIHPTQIQSIVQLVVNPISIAFVKGVEQARFMQLEGTEVTLHASHLKMSDDHIVFQPMIIEGQPHQLPGSGVRLVKLLATTSLACAVPPGYRSTKSLLLFFKAPSINSLVPVLLEIMVIKYGSCLEGSNLIETLGILRRLL